ncbi:aminopeptidase N [Brevibacterium litoralis]|uniref:aminopeptidase N n=1 Tax=Brevibacterium litoralis TaxID=3138935 RepID=UPI0032EF386D
MTTNLRRDEARARARLLSTGAYEVHLDLTGAPDPDRTTYTSTTTVEFDSAKNSTTFLDLIAPTVESVEVNGSALDPAECFDGARVTFPVRRGLNTVRVRAQAEYSRSGEGLHRFVDPADGKVYLYSQFEPTDARRMFANFDQPDLKAVFRFVVDAPADFVVLNNTAEETATPVTGTDVEPDEGALRHTFAQTLVQSTYITCVAAGHYASAQDVHVDAETGTETPLRVFTRASLAEHMEAEDIFRVTKQGLDFFHRHFDHPYPWGKYDQIFVPEYNLGAMENPGLVTFTDAYIFRDRVTRTMYESRANVILHEMAHMWFGDLVTMKWWDDLWLKESFADYMGGLALAEATEFTDGWVTFALRRKDWAYRQDQYPTTHPIVADIPDVEAARLNFDGITYAKGASVLKQLVAFVGRDAFMEGTRRYFRQHAHGNTTLDDFLSALSLAAPDRDVHAWAEAWLRTTGVSEVALDLATREKDGQSPTITAATLTQRNSEARGDDDPGTLRPHRMEIAGFSMSGGRGPRTRSARSLRRNSTWEVDLAGASTQVDVLAGKVRPDLLLLNHGDHDFVKVRLDDRSTRTALRSVGRLKAPMDRALVWSALGNAVRDGLLPVEDYVKAYDRTLGREDHPGITAALRNQVLTALDRWIAPDRRDAAIADVLGEALDGVAAAEPGSDAQLDLVGTVLALTRRTAGTGHRTPAVTSGREFASAILATGVGTTVGEPVPGLVVDHALRWNALTALVGLGWADVEDIAQERKDDNSGSGALHAATANAARPLPIVKMRTWTQITEDTSLSNDMLSAKIAGFVAPTGRPILEPYVESYFALLDDLWSSRSMEIAKRLLLGLFPHWSTRLDVVLHRTDTWLETHQDAPSSQRRLLLEQRDEVARTIRLRTV